MTTSMKRFRIIKAVIFAVLVIAASLAESNQFYDVLSSFHSRNFSYNSFLFLDESMRKSAMEELYQCAKEEDIQVFSVAHIRRDFDSDINHLIIFSDDEVKEIIQNSCGIKEKNYTMPNHGMVEVSYLPFANLTQHQYAASNVISYVGKEEAVERLYQRVGTKYGFTAPSVLKSTARKRSSLIWLMLPSLLLVMTFIEIAGIQKSIALKIWNGENGLSIARRFMRLELLTDSVELFLLRISVFLMYTGKIITFPMLLSGGITMILSCLSYLYFMHFDWNKILDDRRKDKRLLPLITLTILIPYSIFKLSLDISLVSRFHNLLPYNGAYEGGRNGWGHWRYDNVENYNIAAACSIRPHNTGYDRICAYVQYQSVPEKPQININADKYGDYICEIRWTDGFLFMDTNGNCLLLDMGRIGDNEVSSVKTIKKFQKEFNGAIDLINERWGFEMVHYPEEPGTEEDTMDNLMENLHIRIG